jgi:CheY-like chemotaxis protein
MAVNERMILLVEDDPDHEALTIRALKKSNIAHNIQVARDGEEAVQLLFGTGDMALKQLPQVVLLDLKLPRSMASKCCAYTRIGKDTHAPRRGAHLLR